MFLPLSIAGYDAGLWNVAFSLSSSRKYAQTFIYNSCLIDLRYLLKVIENEFVIFCIIFIYSVREYAHFLLVNTYYTIKATKKQKQQKSKKKTKTKNSL